MSDTASAALNTVMVAKARQSEALRTRRLKLFCEHLNLYLHQRCVDHQVPHDKLNTFMRYVLKDMVRSGEEYDVVDLCRYLSSEVIREAQFAMYLRWQNNLLT